MIKKIIMYRNNGMYNNQYDVYYECKNGKSFWRTYKIKGVMTDKHFNFIMQHASESVYSKNGKHVADKWEEN